MKTNVGVLAVGIALFCATGPAIAHHGFDTEYDANKKFTVQGVVSKVEWLNPHMRVYVDVTGKDGRVTTWNLELTSPNTIQRQGWGKNDLLPGEKVEVVGFAGKVVETRASLSSIKKLSDGRQLFTAGGPDAGNQPQQ